MELAYYGFLYHGSVLQIPEDYWYRKNLENAPQSHFVMVFETCLHWKLSVLV